MLYNTDCIEFMQDMRQVELVLTDIPYGKINRKSSGLRNLDKGAADVETFDLQIFLRSLIPVIAGSCYIFCSTEQVSEIRETLARHMTTRLCIWEKTNPSPMNGSRLWLSGIECCVFARRPKATFNEHCKNTVWRYPTTRNKLHPTQKPIKLCEYLVSVSSNPGDTVFDPCAGSGTTGVAALNQGRRFVGCEINREYFKRQ